MLIRDPHKLFPHDYVMRYTFVPLVPKWITPNMVTIFRMALTAPVLWYLYFDNFKIGVPLFLLAAFTDMLDGSLARLRGQITEWGTMYDPVADKILIGLVVLLIVMRHVNPLLGILIISVDMIIILGGYIRRKKGKVIGSNIFGKTKMFFQILGVTFLLISLWAGFDLFIPLSIGTFSLAIVMAVISLFTYGI